MRWFLTAFDTHDCYAHTRSGWGTTFSVVVFQWLKVHHTWYQACSYCSIEVKAWFRICGCEHLCYHVSGSCCMKIVKTTSAINLWQVWYDTPNTALVMQGYRNWVYPCIWVLHQVRITCFCHIVNYDLCSIFWPQQAMVPFSDTIILKWISVMVL